MKLQLEHHPFCYKETSIITEQVLPPHTFALCLIRERSHQGRPYRSHHLSSSATITSLTPNLLASFRKYHRREIHRSEKADAEIIIGLYETLNVPPPHPPHSCYLAYNHVSASVANNINSFDKIMQDGVTEYLFQKLSFKCSGWIYCALYVQADQSLFQIIYFCPRWPSG